MKTILRSIGISVALFLFLVPLSEQEIANLRALGYLN